MFQHYYYYYYFYSYHESGFLSHIYIKVNRLFTPVKKFKCKRGLSKRSGISRSKSSKEAQEEAVKNMLLCYYVFLFAIYLLPTIDLFFQFL